MPVVLGLGMLFPTLVEPWHRRFSRMRSWLGGRLVFLLLLGVYGVAVVPLAFLMRWVGKHWCATSVYVPDLISEILIS
jgi:hypothetical protein